MVLFALIVRLSQKRLIQNMKKIIGSAAEYYYYYYRTQGSCFAVRS